MEAWVTLATNDSYSLGALTLAASLRRVQTSRRTVVMVTPGVSRPVLETLHQAFDEVVEVEELDSKDLASLALLDRMELGITFTKIRCWSLTQYTKCVFLDADTLVVQSCDELFGREELSAAPDAGWPDCFNSGVFVFRPNLNTYQGLVQHAITSGSFDGGDQGLLNTFFSSWAHKDIARHLPFTYNMVSSASYSYLPAFKKYGENVKIVHFIGANKPWLAQSGPSDLPSGQFLQLWWQLFTTKVLPFLASSTTPPGDSYITPPGTSSATPTGTSFATPPGTSYITPSGTSYTAPPGTSIATPPGTSFAPPPTPKEDSRSSWEDGQPDFAGTASFDKILAKIENTMSK